VTIVSIWKKIREAFAPGKKGGTHGKELAVRTSQRSKYRPAAGGG